MDYRIECINCGNVEAKEPANVCGHCGGILKLNYSLKDANFDIDKYEQGIWRYRGMFPVPKGEKLTLGEGRTPLNNIARLAQKIGIGHFYVKNEGMNPSASFKDRAMAYSISMAKSMGIKQVLVASAGNASSSAAAYCAAGEIPVYAVVPESCTKSKVLQALAYGAKVCKAPGGYSDSYRLIREYCANHGGFNATTTYINPYHIIGYKTIGYELIEDLGRAPDWVLVPVGAGPLLGALYHAFSDCIELGVIKSMPKLVAIQSDRCAPIVRAFESGKPVQEWKMEQSTIASGMNDELKGYVQDGEYTLSCVKKSKGVALAVSEEEIIDSVLQLAAQGIYAEPASASGVAAARHLRNRSYIGGDDTVVMIATGNGLKNPLQSMPFEERLIRDVSELQDYLKNEII